MAYDENEIDRIKHALGDMCIAWAHLEDGCYLILDYIIGGENSATQILRNELDFGKALQVCKAHAIANNWNDHCDHIPILVDMIDVQIRPNRNRYVHDPLYWGGKSLERHTARTRYLKVPFKGVQVKFIDFSPVSSEEIYALTKAIRAVESYSGAIIQFIDKLEGGWDDAWDHAPSLGIAQLRAYFSIAEYIQLTKSSGATR